jgi:uncharacterized protein YcbK (DUF882 family)
MTALYAHPSFFTVEEFKCKCGCDFGTKESHIDQRLIDKLNLMRLLYKKPMDVTSGARCNEYNKAEGGVDMSAHTPHSVTRQCRAADILIRSSTDRYNLIDLAMHVGFKRIGYGPNFLHFDIAWDLPSPVVFLY